MVTLLDYLVTSVISDNNTPGVSPLNVVCGYTNFGGSHYMIINCDEQY